MAIVMKKFGGSSLATNQQVEEIAQKVVKDHRDGQEVVVAVSARGKTTNQIRAEVIGLGGVTTSEQVLDFAGPAGERISAACLAAAVEKLGIKTMLADGRTIGLIAIGNFGDGKVKRINKPNIITQALNEKKVVILAAYSGINEFDQDITLGRSGSDTFAVAVAASLGAEVCEIYTDVPGMFAVDPRFVEKAKILPNITYWQAMQFCNAGMQVLKERSIQLAANMRIPVRILLSPSFNQEKWLQKGFDLSFGTLVSTGASIDDLEATNLHQTGLAIKKDVTIFNLVDLPNGPGVLEKIFSALKEILIGDLAQSLTPKGRKAIVTFYVIAEYANKVAEALKSLKLNDGTNIERREDLACLTLIDSRMVTESGWIDRATIALAKAKVNIEINPTSGDSILLIVAKDNIEKAAKALAEEFELC